jgi:endonuclease/exonuclease/phosphatase family metal-dependent hydrolase
MRIDHIFISPGLEVSGIEVPHSELARVASDHLPLIAEIRLPGHAPP